VRERLRSLLALQADFLVVGEARDGDEALQLATELKPDVMLLDVSMPKKSAHDVMRELNRACALTRSIVVTAAVEKPDMLKLLQHGARGVVPKDAPTELLFKSIRNVHRGEVWIGRDVMTDVVALLATLSDAGPVGRPSDFGLSAREREVIRLVLEGDTNNEVALRLSIARDTVKHHLTSIFDKTGVSNRLELALFALHHRLVTTD
jgi:DNA-binding NarL/FixJ family response regulator